MYSESGSSSQLTSHYTTSSHPFNEHCHLASTIQSRGADTSFIVFLSQSHPREFPTMPLPAPAIAQHRPQRIEQTPEHTAQLEKLIHSCIHLQKRGYVLYQLTRDDLDRKRRCAQCSKGESAPELPCQTFYLKTHG